MRDRRGRQRRDPVPGVRRGVRAAWVFEVVTAIVLALLCARFAGSAAVLAFGFLGMLSVPLSGIDIAVHRLPDKLTLPAYPVLILLLGIAAVAGNSRAALLRALLGGVALTCAYFLLAVLRPGQLGAGDVKLAGLTGLALGWLGWPVLSLGRPSPSYCPRWSAWGCWRRAGSACATRSASARSCSAARSSRSWLAGSPDS